MPSAPARVCGSCGQAFVGPCPTCTRAREQRRGSAAERGYGGRWRQQRAWFLARYGFCGDRPDGLPPVMSRCHDEGRVTPATQVDHVAPHRGDGGRFRDWRGNWQALCASCGARKSQAGL